MKKRFIKLLIILNVIIILGMMMTGFAYYLSPVTWGWLAEAGYGFAIPLFLNLLMIAVWVCVKLRYVYIPLLGMIICYVPVTTFCPINMIQDLPDSCLMVMSYNTCSFGGGTGLNLDRDKGEIQCEMFHYFKDKNPDILCVQEAYDTHYTEDEMDTILAEGLQYRDTIMAVKGTTLMIISRYPIVSKEKIEYDSNGNASGAFTLDVNGKKVIVVNNHLETNSFSVKEKENFSEVVHGDQGKKAFAKESKFILGKLTNAAKIRKPQADAVAKFVRRHRNQPLILCGDFNDIPLSYAHHTIANELTECYTATGMGTGTSYNKSSMKVRIDNIMCNDFFTPYNCKVLKDINLSDHYPIVCYLKME